MKMRPFMILFSLFIASAPCTSQVKEFNLPNYTQEDGLPSNETYFVYRDSKNYLWIATDKGVVRYDGQVMQTFKLPDNVVFKIREDHKGRIWFFSHTGKLAYFFNEVIYPYPHNDRIVKEIPHMLITDAYVDRDDNIIISSAQRFHYKISASGSIEKVDFLDPKAPFCRLSIVQTGKTDFFPQLNAFTYNRKELHITRKDGNKVIEYKVPVELTGYGQYGCRSVNGKDLYFFAANSIVKLADDGSFLLKSFSSQVLSLNTNANGTIWVGFSKAGAVLLDPGLNTIAGTSILTHRSISSVVEDYEGGTWFSTLDKGLFHLKNIRINYWVGDSSITQEVYRLHSMNDQTLLVGTSQGVYQVADRKISRILNQKNAVISDLFTDSSKNIYVCGHLPGENIFSKKAKRVNRFFFIFCTSEITSHKDQLFWNNGGHLLNQELPGFPRHTMFSQPHYPIEISYFFKPGIVFCDKGGQVWVGSLNGLYRAFPSLDTALQIKPSSTVLSQGITCMRQLDNGLYAIGIRFGGIALMQDTTIIGTITEKDGLLNNSVKYLLPIKNQLWVATAKGVSVIQFKSYQPLSYAITNIGRNEGLYNIIINQLIEYRGNILAATSNGIYAIEEPGTFLGKERNIIPFYINNIRYYKGDTAGITSLRVPFAENSFAIKYSALSFSSPADIKYYYRFANKDTTWQVTTNTELLLENLSPGTYDIELKAGIHGDRRWSVVQHLEIIIDKPWWQNNWLRLAALALIVAAVSFFYNRRIAKIKSQERQKLEMKTTMVEMEQKLLHSQMNPHFIFNSLSSIQQLIVSGDRTEANEYLVKLARLIRQTLDLSTRSFITVEEEKDYLAEYLVLEQYRMPLLFDFSIHVDPAIDAGRTEIPNMMLQPIIENCIRHGIKHLEKKKGFITIRMDKKEDHILCSITDNGVGRSQPGNANRALYAAHKSYGMTIVHKRLSILMGNNTNEDILQVRDLVNNDGSPAGTQVILQLPFKTINHDQGNSY